MAAVTSASSATTVAASEPKSASKAAKEQEDRFLTLLVTQMKNQDPLNPMDNAQLTTQLAQISTVTGIDQVNQTMKSVLEQIKSLESLQATSMDGRDVLIASDRLELKDGTALGAFELSEPADSVLVTIRDAAGAIVREVQLGRAEAGMHTFDWDAASASGARAADGVYTFAIKAQTGNTTVNATTLARAHVEGISRTDGTVQLDLGVFGRRPIADIKEIL